MGWMILALAAAALALFLLRCALKEKQAREDELVARVRTTAYYRQLYPILEQCANCCVEQLLIRQEGVIIRMFRPVNRVIRFDFAERGLDPVDQPETLRILDRVVAMDVPLLDDPRRFWHIRKQERRDAGPPEVWYEFNVQPEYKDVMLRAWYDQPAPEEGVV